MTPLAIGLFGLLLTAIFVIVVLAVLRKKQAATLTRERNRVIELEQTITDSRRRSSQLTKAVGQWDQEIKAREDRIAELAQRLQDHHLRMSEMERALAQAQAERAEIEQLWNRQLDRSQQSNQEMPDLRARLATTEKERQELAEKLKQIPSQGESAIPPGYLLRIQTAEERQLILTRELGDAREREQRLRQEIAGRDARLEASEARIRELEEAVVQAAASLTGSTGEEFETEPAFEPEPEAPPETQSAPVPVFGWAGPIEEEDDFAAPAPPAPAVPEAVAPAGEPLSAEMGAAETAAAALIGEPGAAAAPPVEPPVEPPVAPEPQPQAVPVPEPSDEIVASTGSAPIPVLEPASAEPLPGPESPPAPGPPPAPAAAPPGIEPEYAPSACAILEDSRLSPIQKRMVLEMYGQFVHQRFEGQRFVPGGELDAREALLRDPRLASNQRDALLQIYERFTSRRPST